MLCRCRQYTMRAAGMSARNMKATHLRMASGSAPHRAAGVQGHDDIGEVAQLRHGDAVQRPRHCTARHGRMSGQGLGSSSFNAD